MRVRSSCRTEMTRNSFGMMPFKIFWISCSLGFLKIVQSFSLNFELSPPQFQSLYLIIYKELEIDC